MVGFFEIIEQIETRQPVQNKTELVDLVCTNQKITGVASLNKATQSDVCFLAQTKYANLLQATKAGFVIVTPQNIELVPEHVIPICVTSPYLAYASCSQLFDLTSTQHISNESNQTSIHPTASIAKTATIENGVIIDAFVVIGEGTTIGARTHIASNTSIGDNCKIGNDCVIKPNVVIAESTQMGCGVRIHAGASIGSEGFGFAPTSNPVDGGTFNDESLSGWERIAQLGRVVIGNHVRIGANTCIDRGAIEDTIIEDNVIIDNLVQIAHNVRIGAGTAIAAKSGIAGSTVIGKRCIIGGAVGIVGHITIADDVTLTAMSLITKSIDKSGTYSSGMPAMPSKQWNKAVASLRKLIKPKR